MWNISTKFGKNHSRLLSIRKLTHLSCLHLATDTKPTKVLLEQNNDSTKEVSLLCLETMFVTQHNHIWTNVCLPCTAQHVDHWDTNL